jgi:uncharacterized protein YbbC (DUF1343 family)
MTADVKSGLPMLIGLENCVADRPSLLDGARFGLLMNRASVDRQLRLSCDSLAEVYPQQMVALFTPQHGLWGDAQANMIESGHGRHPDLDVPIYSLYSETRRPTKQMLADLDCLVIDLQDAGTRVYTFIWTLLECLKACADAGVSVLVLDRPNPIGGTIIEGPLLDVDYRSFVGGASIPMRHGLTIGEVARLLNLEHRIDTDLQVVPMTKWSPEQNFAALKRAWIPPSPNLPRLESTLVYPGQVLLEGTNVSEGRGTTTPFEIVGAPYIDAHVLHHAMTSLDLPGVRFLPVQFRPTFDKWAGELCGGVSLHVTDETRFRAYRTTVSLLATLQAQWQEDFRWLDPPYEYETEKPPIDIISGSDDLRRKLSTSNVDRLCHLDLQQWQQRTSAVLLYQR